MVGGVGHVSPRTQDRDGGCGTGPQAADLESERGLWGPWSCRTKETGDRNCQTPKHKTSGTNLTKDLVPPQLFQHPGNQKLF